MKLSTESIQRYINKKCDVVTTNKKTTSIISGIVLEYEPIDKFLIIDAEQGLGVIRSDSIISISIIN